MTRPWVRSRVVPPAPYVTDTYEGASGSSSASVRSRTRSISSVRGGPNSNEKLGPSRRISWILATGSSPRARGREDTRFRGSAYATLSGVVGPKLRHHSYRQRLRGHGYFSRLGPGLVTGAADDDPSGIGTYSQVGAGAGLTRPLLRGH